jgi:hypothetical protein
MVKGQNTNDTIGTRNTVLFCLGWRAPEDSASVSVKEEYNTRLTAMSK